MDENIIAAKVYLSRAISALIDKKPHLTSERMVWMDSWLDQLQYHIGGTTRERSGGAGGCPIWPDAFDLHHEIEVTIHEWQPAEPSETIYQRLQTFEKREWRPQDASLINTCATQIIKWVNRIQELLDPQSVKEVSAPCPECGATTFYRRNTAGEQIRMAALQLTVDQCRCLRCRAVWPAEQFEFLARVIGCDKPEGMT